MYPWQRVYTVCRIMLQCVKMCVCYSYEWYYLFRYMHISLVQRPQLELVSHRMHLSSYLLKYWTKLSMHPVKQAAQQARHAPIAGGSCKPDTEGKYADSVHSRFPSSTALFLNISNISRRRSRRVTIRDPNAIEPNDLVDARLNAVIVGCFG